MRSSLARTFGLGMAVSLAVAAQASPFKPSRQDQLDLGQRAAAEIRVEESVLPESDPLAQEVARVGARLVDELDTGDPAFEYTFEVIDDERLNAFALPGGPIFLYRGLIDKMPKEDMLAGVIAHEIIHVRNEHWARAYARDMERRLLFVGILTILNAGDTLYSLAGITNDMLLATQYSRDNEREADRQGMDLMLQAGYNPLGIAETFELLVAEGSGDTGIMENISTHPDAPARVNDMRRRVDEMPAEIRNRPRADRDLYVEPETETQPSTG